MKTSPARFILFDTAIGRCGIVWSERGVVRLHLPERDESATRERLLKGITNAAESEPPAAVRETTARIIALLEGEHSDLSSVPLDLEGLSEFHRRVYDVTRAIPPGATRTYGQVAAQIGDPGAARAVGRALGENPVPIIVPCHRVVATGGKIGGFSANGGATTKIRLLSIESRRAPALG